MREILFKAKRKDNGEWMEGFIFEIKGKFYIMETTQTFMTAYYNEESVVDFNMRAVEIDPDTLCQYTGLTDKNGKKIWENDILHRAYHAEEDCIVQWHDGSYRFKTIHGSYRQDPMTFLSLCFTEKMVCNLKVIGNIFDNVDLLEVE